MSEPPTPVPKAIGSLAKKQSDVTRQGTQKLKFVPTLPQRRKKEETTIERDHEIERGREEPRGHGRGQGRGRGRGRGRGTLPVISTTGVEMTASGPFAMGPSKAGSGSRSSTMASGPVFPTTLRAGPIVKEEKEPSLKKEAENTDDDYSDPDEGVEIIDMENVRQMDWMAPDSQQVLDFGENEDFAGQANIKMDDSMWAEEKLHLFQFPTPFPTFSSKMNPESKLEPISGVIGQLEIYRSGMVKIRLANDILLNLNAATQPSFFQQAVNLDVAGKQLIILGEVNKQFVASPNVEALLRAIRDDEHAPVLIEADNDLIKIDP